MSEIIPVFKMGAVYQTDDFFMPTSKDHPREKAQNEVRAKKVEKDAYSCAKKLNADVREICVHGGEEYGLFSCQSRQYEIVLKGTK